MIPEPYLCVNKINGDVPQITLRTVRRDGANVYKSHCHPEQEEFVFQYGFTQGYFSHIISGGFFLSVSSLICSYQNWIPLLCDSVFVCKHVKRSNVQTKLWPNIMNSAYGRYLLE